VSVRLYFDVHVRLAVALGLRLRGVDVLRAQEDGTAEDDDSRLLDRATELGRILFTQDRDFLKEAARRQRAGEHFSGIVYAHQLEVTIGECVSDLEVIAETSEPKDWTDRVEHLPL
jgi:predicted nuclease of predicted toxin-antitoxin system